MVNSFLLVWLESAFREGSGWVVVGAVYFEVMRWRISFSSSSSKAVVSETCSWSEGLGDEGEMRSIVALVVWEALDVVFCVGEFLFMVCEEGGVVSV